MNTENLKIDELLLYIASTFFVAGTTRVQPPYDAQLVMHKYIAETVFSDAAQKERLTLWARNTAMFFTACYDAGKASVCL